MSSSSDIKSDKSSSNLQSHSSTESKSEEVTTCNVKCCLPKNSLEQFNRCPERINTMIWLVNNQYDLYEQAMNNDFSFLEEYNMSLHDIAQIIQGWKAKEEGKSEVKSEIKPEVKCDLNSKYERIEEDELENDPFKQYLVNVDFNEDEDKYVDGLEQQDRRQEEEGEDN